MFVTFLMLCAGLLLLATGADRFVHGAASSSRYLGLSPLLIGLTIASTTTSAPEILIGSIAAWRDKTDIAIGNAIGSNITNIGLALGLTALFIPLHIKSNTLKREFGLMLLATAIAFVLLFDQHLGRIDGMILLFCFFAFIAWTVWVAKRTTRPDALIDELNEEYQLGTSLLKSLLVLLFGLVLLLAGAELLVRGAVRTAQYYGLSDLIIGLTIIAVGTSLPELATSILSVLKKEPDIAIGNIIGSNIVNMLAVIGIPVMISPITTTAAVLSRDFPVMIGITLLFGGLLLLHGSGKLSRIKGGILFICFIAYQYSLYHMVSG